MCAPAQPSPVATAPLPPSLLTARPERPPTHRSQGYLDCDKTTASEIVMSWNPWATQYEIEGCAGVAPRLHLRAGKKYTFIQNHLTNWYHPVGFAIEAGGAHTICDGGAECPEVETGLQYFVDGTPAPENPGGSGFGLDGYEPLFFGDRATWASRTYYAELTIPAGACYDGSCYRRASSSDTSTI